VALSFVSRFEYDDEVMTFDIVGEITAIETLAVGSAIRELSRLRKVYGSGRWRKRKGIASVRLPDGTICKAEVHGYEAHGIGRKEPKIKRFLDE
jgi:hypothetical protein